MSLTRHLAVAFLMLSCAALVRAEAPAAPIAPVAVVAPPAPRAAVIDPARVPVAARAASAPRPRLVPNELPPPASAPAGTPLPLPQPATPGSDFVRVLDPDGWRADAPDAGRTTGAAAGVGPVRSADAAPPTSSGLSPSALSPSAIPLIDTRFDGSFDNGVAPPDPVMAVGRGHVVSLVNSLIQFNAKTGALVGGPYTLRAFFDIPAGFGISDPLAMYDPFVDRFIVTVMADNGSTRDARLCVAFSQTGDPTQPWNKYFIDADLSQPNNWLDYPSNGLDRFAVYFTGNMFDRTAGYSNSTLFIYDKFDGYAGRPLRGAHLIDVRTTGNGSAFRLRPAYVTEIAQNDDMWFAQMDGTSDRINLWKLHGSRFVNPALTAYAVPTPSIYIGPGTARQPGAGGGVATLGGSSWNTWYRNGTVWVSNAIRSATGVSSWVHKIDVAASPPVRSRTWQIDAGTRDVYFPHVIPDVEDDDFAFFSAYSGTDTFVTGRLWNIEGATGAVRAAENTATGSVRNESSRHGDYFAVQTDPLDRNRVWGITQYQNQSTFTGNVRIASSRFEDVPVPVPPVPVPDGSVRAARSGASNVNVTWNASSCVAPNHHIVWFDLAGIRAYPTVAETCAIGSAGTWTGVPPAGNVGFVVVADDGGTAEGSHGRDSAGHERPSQARACGIQQKVWSASCTP